MLIIGSKGFTVDYIRDYRDDVAAAIAAALAADPNNLFLWQSGILLNIRTKESNVPTDFDWVMNNLADYWDNDGNWVVW